MSEEVKFYKVNQLPQELESNTIYFLYANGETQGYVTTSSGIAMPIGNLDLIKKAITEDYPRYTKIGFSVAGDPISTGVKGLRSIPFDMTITEWSIIVDSESSNSVKINIEKSLDLVSFTSIISTEIDKPSLLNSKSSTLNDLQNWEDKIDKSYYLRFTIEEITNIKTLWFSMAIKEIID